MSIEYILFLIFIGLVVLATIIFTVVSIIQDKIRRNKITKAYKNKDLLKARRLYQVTFDKYKECRDEYNRLIQEIDDELKARPYLTKVAVARQDVNLEKLRIRVEEVFKKKLQMEETQRAYYLEWKELEKKYGIYDI